MDVKLLYSADISNNGQLTFAVICASYKGKWIFVRHKNRDTWEIPGGHREKDEYIDAAATRELYEETGALNYEIEPVCCYSVTVGDETTYGKLFFAKVTEMGPLPESEISEVRFLKEMPANLTYPQIQPKLQEEVLRYLVVKKFRLLEKDKVRNINIINFMKSYPVQTIDIAGDSILVRGRSDEDWVYISSKSLEEFTRLIEGLDEDDKCFAVLEDWMLPYIVKDREIRAQLTCMKLVYDGQNVLPPVKPNIVDLLAADAQYIFENSKYKDHISVEYIEDRINNGIGLGICEQGKLVAWVITHDDGAIGFLNVLEEYRRKGYGSIVTSIMIRKLLKQGKLPFVHIEEDNIRSMNLALKAGFKKDRQIRWIKLR